MDARMITAFTRVFDALLPAHEEISASVEPRGPVGIGGMLAMTRRQRRRLAARSPLRVGGHARRRNDCRVPALVTSIGEVAERQASEIADGADGEHLPGVRNQQR